MSDAEGGGSSGRAALVEPVAAAARADERPDTPLTSTSHEPTPWAPAPRPLKAAGGRGALSPGGLFVGAEGTDASGWSYRLAAPLDRGGMGELFVAEVRGAGAPTYAVVKRLLPELTDDADYVAMFRAEADVMAQLDHTSVVRVLGMPELEGAPCLALEFVEGRSAQQLIARGRRLGARTPPSLAAYIATRVAEALDHVHTARGHDGAPLELVHRDVTPGNVLLGFGGEVKLTDFGIAKSRMSNVSTTVGIVKGKARYLAPEQILGRPASPRSDIFSAGLVLVELLTGQPLFERGSIPKTLYAIIHGERPPMRELLPAPAHPLAPLLEQALATSPEHRPESARRFAEELARLSDSLGPGADTSALGQHLRGLFSGTRGPLTRALERPALELPRSGAAPLDPSGFVYEPRLTGSLTPLPLLDPVEVEASEGPPPRSAPHEVDEALSVLAWLQAREAPPTPDEVVETVVAPAPRPRSRLPSFMAGACVGAAVVAASLAALLMSGGSPASILGDAPATPTPPAPSKPQLAHSPAAPSTEDADSKTLGPSFRLPPLSLEVFVGPPSPPEPPPPEPPPASARLDVLSPRRASLWIDGRRHRRRVPVKGLELSPGPHEITIRRGRRTRVYELQVVSDEQVVIGRDLRRTPPPPDGPDEERTAPAASAPRLSPGRSKRTR